MDALKKACKNHLQINFEPLTKVYFKKFFYKVEVLLELYTPRSAVRRISRFRRTQAQETAVADCKFADEYRSRTEGGYCSFFFTNEDDAKLFIKKNKSYIVQVVAPRHVGDKAALGDDTKVRLRDTLFWNCFRWAITLKGLKEAQFTEIYERICESFGLHPDTAHTSSRVMFSYTYPRKIFMTDEQDVILLKMIAYEFIGKIEKAVLRSEVDDQL